MVTERKSAARQLTLPAFLCVVGGFLFLVWIIYFSYGRLLVRQIYDGSGAGPAAQLFHNRGAHPLAYYYGKTQSYLFLISILFTGAAAYLFLFIRNLAAIKQCARQERINLLRKLNAALPFSLSRTLPVAAACVSTGVVFWLVYLYFGMAFQRGMALSAENLMFQLDAPQVIDTIAGAAPQFHRAFVHPLFALLVHPWGVPLAAALHSSARAAVVLTAGCGGAATVLAFLIFRRIVTFYLDAFLATLVFGLSFSQLFFGAVPDTQAWAVCSLAATYLVFLQSARSRRVNLSLWVALGVFSFGVTVTNLMQTGICLAVALAVDKKEHRLARALLWAAAVFGISLFLSLAQKLIYSSSEIFVSWKILGEQGFASGFLFQQPWETFKHVIRQLFIFNVVAPVPDILLAPGRIYPALSFSSGWYFGSLGMSALIFWLAALASGLAVNVQQVTDKMSKFEAADRGGVSGLSGSPVITGLSLCLGFNVLLHCFYGVNSYGRAELFTYSGNVTLLLLMLVFLGLAKHRTALRILCMGLIILAGYNNFTLISMLTAIYR
ncbi:MAG TPA: hypothetical protein P5110_01325 [Candidatus Omnitrophota bacterium]|nr:hypothetical protein [Candidatus Omnitrophota bacterium]HRZ14127.1 hypothetical protein [Candidatus Omnitrophota bacterium]